jgi:subtilase family serine protease
LAQKELPKSKRRLSFQPHVEVLEEMTMPSAVTFSPTYVLSHLHHAGGTAHPQSSPSPPSGAMTPSEIRTAYGVNGITFTNNGQTVTADGTGQVIAIVDAFDDPNIATDLANFDTQFSLQAPASFTKIGVDSNGNGSTTSFPTPDTGWATEIALDVEWSHVIAPNASIVLVEANSSSLSDLMAAVDYARNYSNVTAVSMSWGANEFSGETSYDSYFTTPSGHAGVTFFGSSGDSGNPGIWPAMSSHVVAAGGTSLILNSDGSYSSESGWSGSGGSLSTQVSAPSYQSGLVIHSGTQTISANGRRAAPDLSWDADPNTGEAILDSYGSGGWIQVGGTSASAPQLAGLMALVNQGRVAAGQSSLDGYTQTLPALYQLPSNDFHDVTTGSNAHFGSSNYSAGTGYDLVTGRGTPVGGSFVPGLAGYSSSSSQPPTITTAAHFVANSATLTTAQFSVAASDSEGDNDLTYTWSVSGTPPAGVSFSPNQSASATTVTATFSRAGTYNLLVTVTDQASGLSATSTVSYVVTAQVQSVTVTPASVSVADTGTRQFSATATDQFGFSMSGQSFTWSVDPVSLGSINPTTGLYSAPTSGTGNDTVRATDGSVSGTASVTVTSATGPTISSVTASNQTPTSVTLTVAASEAGNPPLTYQWTVSPTSGASISSAGATTTNVNFSAAGTYTFTVTVSDPSNLSATGTVTVTVNPTFTFLVVTPSSVTLTPGAQQQFTATPQDQFHNTYTGAVSVNWSAGTGTITSAGLYTAPSSGSDTVTASSGTVQATASVFVSNTTSGSLFSDNFANGASQWSVHSGRYYLVTYSNGVTRLMVQNYGDLSRIVAGNKAWTNYSYQGTLTFQRTYYGGNASLMARVVDDSHFYFFGYSAAMGTWFIARKDGSNVTTMLATGKPYTAYYNTDYVVQANLFGSTLSLYVNGVLQVSVTDSKYANGQIGFTGTWAVATLGNVSVNALSGPVTSKTAPVFPATVSRASVHGASTSQATPGPVSGLLVTHFSPASSGGYSSFAVGGFWRELDLAEALGEPFWRFGA